MALIEVAIGIATPPDRVWDYIKDIATHTQWMRDAEAITFTSAITSGVGTTFDCATRIGPFRTTDRMEVTEWAPAQALGIRHRGVVTGEGRFTLEPTATGTRFVWSERLAFPWWQGGALGGYLARPVFRRLWQANLARLRAICESR